MIICVCDDDMAFARTLSQKIRYYAAHLPDEYGIEVQTFFSADSFLEFAKNFPIDILFLDIDMPKKTGFDLARDLMKESIETQIIFVSSYENLVYNSFEFNPFYFLRKSFVSAELESVFSRAIQKLQRTQLSTAIKTTEGTVRVRIRDILLIESHGNYYDVCCTGSAIYKCRGTLASIEEEMRTFGLIRVHSAFLVNLEHIQSVRQNRRVILSNNSEISVSARKWAEFKDVYADFLRRRMT